MAKKAVFSHIITLYSTIAALGGCTAELAPVSEPTPQVMTQPQPCSDAQFASVSRNNPGEIVCLPLTICESDEYEAVAPTYSSDRRCEPVRDCKPGERVSVAATASSDRQCEACALGTSFSSEINSAECASVKSCESDQYIATAATLATDLTCGDCQTDIVVENGECMACVDAKTCTQFACDQGYVLRNGTCALAVQPDNSACMTADDKMTCACTNGYFGQISWEDDQDLWLGTCTAWTDCDPGSFVSVAGSTTADRQCEACTAFRDYSSAVNASACTALSECGAGQYVAAAPSLSSDRVCDDCILGTNFSTSTNAVSCTDVSVCNPGQYVLISATISGDRVCGECQFGLDYSSNENASSCTALTDCNPGEYVSAQPSVTSNRVCGACTANVNFSTAANAVNCTTVATCNPGQFVATDATVSSNRVCGDCTLDVNFSTSTNAVSCTTLTDCAPGQFVATDATVSSNRVCGDCTLDVNFSTSTNAVSCTTLTDCLPGQFVAAEGTVSANRVCENCMLDVNFSTSTNAGSCAELRDCLPGEFVSDAATLASNRICADCDAGVNFTGVSNASSCTPVSDCDPGEYILTPPTRSSDRGCQSCSMGVNYSSLSNVTQCSLVQSCASNEFEVTPPTVSSDRTCEVLTVEVTSSDTKAYEGGLDSAVITVSLSAIQATDVSVDFALAGSAQINTDYLLTLNGAALSSPLVIPAGQLSVEVTVEPIASAALEVAETVVFSLQNSANYDLGTNEAVTITIVEYGPSNGNVYYVDENGSNANSGDEANPFATISYAVNQLTAGDTLYIKDGTYTNSGYSDNHGPTGDTSVNNGLLARITASGTPNNWITIAAYPDGNDVRPLLKFDGTGGIQFNAGANYIRVEGLEIEGANREIQYDWAHDHRWTKENFYTGRGIYSWGPVHHIVVENCNVHHTPGSGIRFNKADYILVQGNIVSNTTWWSTSAESAIVIATAESIDTENVVKFLYSGNVVYNNWNFMEFCNTPLRSSTDDEYGNCDYYTGGIIDGQGLYVTRNNDTYLFGRMRFENNIAFNNGFGGVVYHKTDRGELINNLVFMNGAYPGISNYTGMTVNTSDDLTIINNVIWARDGNDYGLKNNGNASNVVTHNNYIVGRTQFGTAADNQITDFSVADDFNLLFTAVQDISLANPVPTATTGATAPANIDALVQGYNLDFRLLDTAFDLIDTGTTSFAPSLDRVNTPRPQGNGVDIGPHERESP